MFGSAGAGDADRELEVAAGELEKKSSALSASDVVTLTGCGELVGADVSTPFSSVRGENNRSAGLPLSFSLLSFTSLRLTPAPAAPAAVPSSGRLPLTPFSVAAASSVWTAGVTWSDLGNMIAVKGILGCLNGYLIGVRTIVSHMTGGVGCSRAMAMEFMMP